MTSSVNLRERRKTRQRFKMRRLSSSRLRLCIHRTNNHIYAQLIDDLNRRTIASVSTLSREVSPNIKNGGNKESAILVGKLIAEKAIKAGVERVVFDRSGFLYHGRVRSLADGAREGGLKF